MTQTARDIFVVGLRNAHAMEVQARELMERQSERLDDYPEVKAKVAAHLQETHQQLKRLEQCLEACGETTSTLKDTAQSVAAWSTCATNSRPRSTSKGLVRSAPRAARRGPVYAASGGRAGRTGGLRKRSPVREEQLIAGSGCSACPQLAEN